MQEAQIHLSDYVFLLFAGDEEDFSSAHDKIVNCVTACIHIARATDVIQQQKNLIDFFLISLSPNFSWPGIALISLFILYQEGEALLPDLICLFPFCSESVCFFVN